MNTEQPILFQVSDQIATVTLNRPKSLNAMNDELVTTLTEVLAKISNDQTIRVVIITGAGRAFCAGGDLAYLESLTEPSAAKEFITKVGQLVQQIRHLPQPVIAMVNGVAAGAGFNLALAADIVCSNTKARFAQSFAKVGLVPDCGGMYLLPRTVGLHKAKELMFTADLIDAATAKELGIINHIFSDDELTEKTQLLAANIKQAAPLAIALMKETLNQADSLSLTELLSKEALQQVFCMQTHDHREGLSAFKEKRQPQFLGK